MIELPEAQVLAAQFQTTLVGKTIHAVVAASSPHKFAWYHGDPAAYPARLVGSLIQSAEAHGGMLQVNLSRAHLLFSEGVNLRLLAPGQPPPPKHQLLLHFSDGGALSASVQMYGGLLCWGLEEELDNPYYQVACQKPSPLNPALFTEAYFLSLFTSEAAQPLNLKAALATGQRVPGLGNGVLQDILWKARLSPKRRLNTLSAAQMRTLYHALVSVLAEMTRLGGRDTEKDLFGNPGGYLTVMSAKNNGAPCPACGTPITREAFMGGSVYTCPSCQR